MKVTVTVLCLVDARGSVSWNVVKDTGDWTRLGGHDNDGKYQQFDSCETYHAYSWADRHGFTLTTAEREIELPLEATKI